MAKSVGKGKAKVVIKKYDANGRLIEIKEFEGNSFLTCGVNTLWNIIAGNITNWQLGICVGDSNASVSSSQTCLQGSNQACSNASSVNVNSNELIVTASFGGTQANFTWYEACVAVTNVSCPNCTYACFDRIVQAMGVKQPGTTWQITITLSIS